MVSLKGDPRSVISTLSLAFFLIQDEPYPNRDLLHEALATALKGHVVADLRLEKDGQELQGQKSEGWKLEGEGNCGISYSRGIAQNDEYQSYTIFDKGVRVPRVFVKEKSEQSWRDWTSQEKRTPACIAAIQSGQVFSILEDAYVYGGGLSAEEKKNVKTQTSGDSLTLVFPGVAPPRLGPIFSQKVRWESDMDYQLIPEKSQTTFRLNCKKKLLLGMQVVFCFTHRATKQEYTVRMGLEISDYDKSLQSCLPDEIVKKLVVPKK